MKGQVQGSSPKRHIKYTHNRNPTFHSYHLFDVLQPNPESAKPNNPKEVRSRSVFALGNAIARGLPTQKSELQMPVFNPQPESKPIKKERVVIQTRSKSSGKLELDSLHAAETQFQASKLRNPLYYISSNSFKTPAINPTQTLNSPPNNSLHFQNTRSIMQKQNVDYNIISNIART